MTVAPRSTWHITQCDARLRGRGVTERLGYIKPLFTLGVFSLWKDYNIVSYNTTVRVMVYLTNTLLVLLCGCCQLEEFRLSEDLTN